jgi:hypothetical protein
MLAAVTRERLFGDLVEQLRTCEMRQPDTGDRQPGDLSGTRILSRHC